MGDLVINSGNELDEFPEFRKKKIQIEINENKSTIVGIKRELDDLVNVKQKKFELQIELLEKEIERKQQKLREVDNPKKVIDAEFVDK